jgi:hypothetical protein
METLEIISIGDDLGVILPEKLIKILRLGSRDFINIVETPNGFRLIPFDSENAEEKNG